MVSYSSLFFMVIFQKNEFHRLQMAERYDAREVLRMARKLVLELQKLIDNK